MCYTSIVITNVILLIVDCVFKVFNFMFPMAEAIFLSLQHCAYCKRLGASIKCCAEGCAQLYHYPCAGAAGTFQDIRSLSLLCPEHHELAVHKCTTRISLNRKSALRAFFSLSRMQLTLHSLVFPRTCR